MPKDEFSQAAKIIFFKVKTEKINSKLTKINIYSKKIFHIFGFDKY